MRRRSARYESQRRARYLADLAVTLRLRYRRTEVIGDVAEAIETNRTAIAMTPADDTLRSGFLSNLHLALRTRYADTGA